MTPHQSRSAEAISPVAPVQGTPCTTDLECSNGLFCDGMETCDPVNGCQPGTPPALDDGVDCTRDVCDEVSNVIAHLRTNSKCDDNNPCTLDVCELTGCVHFDASCCGDDTCDGNEDVVSCPTDCFCGNGSCDFGESFCDCPEDCVEVCGDGCCSGLENSCTCAVDCGSVCGDGCCSPDETCLSCDTDCTCSTVYSNRLGTSILIPNGDPGEMVADDIATVASIGCVLGSLRFRVSGDPMGDGSGIGGFSVDFALFSGCPSAGAIPLFPIATATLPDNGNFEVVFEPDAAVEIEIPTNAYFGVRFSRSQAGILAGAPATIGFSADLFDTPLAKCSANFGGFPGFDYGSFDLEIRVRDDCPGGVCSSSTCVGGNKDGNPCTFSCPAAFPAYKNSMPGRDFFTVQPNFTLFADDLKLAVPVDANNPCNLVSWEVGFKGTPGGTRAVQAELHTLLDPNDPENGGRILGTKITGVVSGSSLTTLKNTLDTPIPITQQDLFVVFNTQNGFAGPILTCREAELGSTDDVYFLHASSGWFGTNFGSGCHAGFEVALTCAGSPPSGACCDTLLTAGRTCVGGSRNGLACNRDSECRVCSGGKKGGTICFSAQDCPGGTCPPDSESFCVGDAVCRESPEMSCVSPNLWQEGAVCVSVCIGGSNDAKVCTRQAECPGGTCPGTFGLECPFNTCRQGRGDCSLAHSDVGCQDETCCGSVCELDPWCCTVEWDEVCVRESQDMCQLAPDNAQCETALAMTANSRAVESNVFSFSSAGDPAFSCHGSAPACSGHASTWYTFEATHDSARIHTCNTLPPADDTLVQVFRVGDSTAPQSACQTLEMIACGDDATGCGRGLGSDVCITGLIPGDTYYVMLAGKTQGTLGVVQLDIESPCPSPPPNCPAGTVDWLTPPPGVIDARQPFSLDDPADLLGIDTITVSVPAGADAACFSVLETSANPNLHPPYPVSLTTNHIESVTPLEGEVYRIELARPITPGEVTTLAYTDEFHIAHRADFVSLPGDVGANGTARRFNIGILVSILNGDSAPPWPGFSDDIDHSGATGPRDLLRLIDLFNQGWLNVNVPDPGVCP